MPRLLAAAFVSLMLALPPTAPRAGEAKRLVAIGGAVTEIIYALGAENLLVAVDSTSLYPEAADELPDIGYMRRLSAEPILALQPDQVIAIEGSGPPAVLDQLAEAGIDVRRIADEPTPDGVVRKIEEVATIVGLSDQGERLAAKVHAEFEVLAEEIGTPGAPLRVMFVLNTGRGAPMVGGTGTAADGIMRLAGAANAITGLEGYKPLSPEAAIQAAPDVILTMDRSLEIAGGADALLDQPDIALTPAGRNRALVSMDGLLLLGFGPRTAEAARELAQALANLTPEPLN
ncbi:MAG: ABC transporter substrate-binding protein [Alphaproteobacteria bacterium]